MELIFFEKASFPATIKGLGGHGQCAPGDDYERRSGCHTWRWNDCLMMSFTRAWNTAGALVKMKGMKRHSKCPKRMLKAVFHSSPVCILTRWQGLHRSSMVTPWRARRAARASMGSCVRFTETQISWVSISTVWLGWTVSNVLMVWPFCSVMGEQETQTQNAYNR